MKGGSNSTAEELLSASERLYTDALYALADKFTQGDKELDHWASQVIKYPFDMIATANYYRRKAQILEEVMNGQRV